MLSPKQKEELLSHREMWGSGPHHNILANRAFFTRGLAAFIVMAVIATVISIVLWNTSFISARAIVAVVLIFGLVIGVALLPRFMGR